MVRGRGDKLQHRVGARGLQHYALAAVGRVPLRGVPKAAIRRLGFVVRLAGTVQFKPTHEPLEQIALPLNNRQVADPLLDAERF